MDLRPDDQVLDLATGTADVPWLLKGMGTENPRGFKNT